MAEFVEDADVEIKPRQFGGEVEATSAYLSRESLHEEIRHEKVRSSEQGQWRYETKKRTSVLDVGRNEQILQAIVS
jgi:hypothetical protein